MNSPRTYIDLGRQFAELMDGNEAETAALQSYISQYINQDRDKGWEWIYQQNCSCVILGEPGSGKSVELQHQARMLRLAGRPALYANLRALVSDDAPYLDRDDPLIQRWRKTDETAWFFLDSVDESKLEHVDDFHTAITRMSRWVGADANRARYVISSRISEWQSVTDRRLVEESLLLPPRPSDEAKLGDEKYLKVLTLLPLTNIQARQFQAGTSSGQVDKSFFDAVDNAHAWDFMRRPLDVADLYGLWKAHGRLGRLGEVVEHAVSRLLSERRNKSSLPIAQARDGAELLAACLALHKSVSLALNESASRGGSALTVRDCLPDNWTAEDGARLVQLPLFDAAAYGRVRFHHRTYQDYLAATWLATQMQADLPPSELKQLLFAESAGGRLTLRPSLAPVAAWLACIDANGARWQEMHRQALLHAAPWVFFSHGDPQSLPIDYRANVLRVTVEHYKGRDHVRIDLDAPTLKRFADARLSDVVSGWISDRTVSGDIRADYLALVKHGNLIGALPSVIAAAIDPSEDDYVRATALICVAHIGTLSHRARVVEAFAGSEPISLRLGVHLIEVAYPDAIDESDLLQLLNRIEMGTQKTRPSILYLLDKYIEQETPIERVPALLGKICKFVCDTEAIRRDRGWAADWLGPLLARLLDSPHIDDAAYEAIFRAIELLGIASEAGVLNSLSDRRDFEYIQTASKNHPDIRRGWYWRQVERFRRARGQEPTMLFELDSYYAPFKAAEEDLKWWRADAAKRANPLDRAFALRVILAAISHAPGRPLFPPWSVLGLAMKEKGLRRQILDYVRWGVAGPFYRLRNKWKYEWRLGSNWQRRKRKILDRYWVLRNRIEFVRRRADLRSGEWWPGIRFIIEGADRSNNRWGSHEFHEMTKRYGATTVSAAVEGADAIWRKQRSLLPHEKPERNQTSLLTLVGLTALECAWDRKGGRFFHSLSAADAESATRFALDELNGFPPWFQTLADSHHDAVAKVIAEALRGEWAAIPDDSQSGSPTLQRLVYGGNLPDSLYLPVLQELLLGSLPLSSLVLVDSLRLVVRSPSTSRQWLITRARTILQESKEFDDRTWPWLLAVWLMDADWAFEFMRNRLAVLNGSEQQAACMALCAAMYGDTRQGLSCPQPDYDRPDFLLKFIPWVYGYIRPEEDVVHDGVFSPGDRDNAERFRDSLLARLENRSGQDADDTLMALAALPELARIRDSLLMRIDNRKSLRADDFLILPEDVKALQTTHERIPRSRADLFHTAFSRLLAFKERVEAAEVSIRNECNSGWDEAGYQDWTQRHMQAVANGRYTIPSEAKVDPGKFPDLRFESPLVDGAISVEVKVATFDHWSYAALEGCLRAQLVGQYLRASNAKHGILLLFRADKNRQWRTADAITLEWNALLKRLSSCAKDVLVNRPDIERLEIIGIDVTEPVPPPR